MQKLTEEQINTLHNKFGGRPFELRVYLGLLKDSYRSFKKYDFEKLDKEILNGMRKLILHEGQKNLKGYSVFSQARTEGETTFTRTIYELYFSTIDELAKKDLFKIAFSEVPVKPEDLESSQDQIELLKNLTLINQNQETKELNVNGDLFREYLKIKSEAI